MRRAAVVHFAGRTNAGPWGCRRTSRWPEGDGVLIEPTRAKPPCVRIADNRRQFVRDMVQAGYTFNATIARHLALQGEKISARSVGRFRCEAVAEAPPPGPSLPTAPA